MCLIAGLFQSNLVAMIAVTLKDIVFRCGESARGLLNGDSVEVKSVSRIIHPGSLQRMAFFMDSDLLLQSLHSRKCSLTLKAKSPLRMNSSPGGYSFDMDYSREAVFDGDHNK